MLCTNGNEVSVIDIVKGGRDITIYSLGVGIQGVTCAHVAACKHGVVYYHASTVQCGVLVPVKQSCTLVVAEFSPFKGVQVFSCYIFILVVWISIYFHTCCGKHLGTGCYYHLAVFCKLLFIAYRVPIPYP